MISCRIFSGCKGNKVDVKAERVSSHATCQKSAVATAPHQATPGFFMDRLVATWWYVGAQTHFKNQLYNPLVQWKPASQWEIQDPNMEVRKRAICLAISSGDIP